MEFQDKTISCKDCQQDFTFSAKEQEFYQEKGFRNEPVRCKPCREAVKKRVAAHRAKNRGGGGGGRGRGHGGGGGGRGPRELFDATCSECGVDTKVPFRPTPGKSVLCRDCFRK